MRMVLDTNVLLSGIAYPASVRPTGAGGQPDRCAAWHAAEVLITGDKALLALRERYPIRTPAEFWAAHGGF